MGDPFYQINYSFHLKMTISNRLFQKESFATQMKLIVKQMGELGGQNAHSTLNTDCETGV